ARRVDIHGDPLPDGAIARFGTERLRAADSALALSPDGKTIITVSERLVVRGLADQFARDSVLSPDGKWLLSRNNYSSDDDPLIVWDVAAGKRVDARK